MATSISEDDERYCDRNHAKNLLDGLDRLRAESQFCDVELRVGKTSFCCHRAVLSACSPYFQGMFSGGMREVHQDVVDILGIEGNVFKLLLDYMYSGKFTKAMFYKKLISILHQPFYFQKHSGL